MCVIIASKIKQSNTDKENWFLYKIRDRAYIPEYRIKYTSSSKNSTQVGYIVDNASDWSEGVNNKGIMIVNSALQNHEDKKDGTSKGQRLSLGKVARNGVIIRKALKMSNINDVVKFLTDVRFEGNTFVSDGKRLFVLEIFLSKVTKSSILANLEIDPIADKEDVKKILLKHIKPDDYDVAVKEIKSKSLVVRTNHGILLPKAGYQPESGIGYKSSVYRRKVVINTIKALNPTNPFDIIMALKQLNTTDIHNDDIMRPIRTMPDSPYQTTTILCLTSTGIMFVLPLRCKFENTNSNRIQKDRDVHIVILPKKLSLFTESIENEGFSEVGILKLLQGKKDEFINIVNNSIMYTSKLLKENLCQHQ